MDYHEYKAKFIADALTLIEQELNEQTELSTQVLFGDELGADDWTPKDAVKALFKYATDGGWG